MRERLEKGEGERGRRHSLRQQRPLLLEGNETKQGKQGQPLLLGPASRYRHATSL